jgi:hypothetical protein
VLIRVDLRRSQRHQPNQCNPRRDNDGSRTSLLPYFAFTARPLVLIDFLPWI